MVFKEETIKSEYVFKGKLINVRRDLVTTPSGKSEREIAEHCGGVVMAALKPDGTLIMEHQFRKAIESVLFELPAGKMDPGEQPETAALRELREETGYTAKNIRYLTKSYPSAGFSTEILYSYVCTDLVPGETDLDEDEDIEIADYPLDTLYNMVMSGEIQDAKSQVVIMMVKAMVDRGEFDEYLGR
ncbi:MAG: NUDIX hydrolase [Eubacteriales bacterium]|nr:NUDIX hydrolase [Eubacteriales bacterium]